MFGRRLVQLTLSVLLLSTPVFAQTDDEEREPAAVIEFGGVPNWSLTDSLSSFGPTVAVEMTPVRNWLEFEMGVTSLFSRHSTEWSTDFLFKKPWDLTKTIEFMAGIGPEWVNTRKNGSAINSLGAEVVLDLMFWTSAKHKIGWYLEPSYDYSFRAGHESSMGGSIGLLIGLPSRRAHSTHSN